MKHLAVLIFCSIGFLAEIVGQGHAAPIGFGVDGDANPNVLFTVDLATGIATNIGTGLGAQFEDVEGLGFDPTTSILYGIDDSSDNLLSINITTGVGTLIGSLGVSIGEPGFAIDRDGVGFAADEDGNNLYSVDLNTGFATLLGGTGADSIDGLAFIGSTLYGTSPVSNSLYTLNTMSGVATLVGAFGTSTLSLESGLASDETFLYAGDDDGDYLRINPTTGAATLVTGNGRDIEGLAIQPVEGKAQPPIAAVPEPSTVLLFGTGLTGLALWRMRKGRTKKK